MIRFNSLRERIQTGFLLFCLTQFVLVLALAIFSYHYGEDSALSRAVESNGTIEEFVGEQNIPRSMYVLLAELDVGTHELSGQDNPAFSGKELHVSVAEDAGVKTWRMLEFSERVDNGSLFADYALFVAAAFLSVFLFGGWLGRTIAQRVSQPLEVLVDRIKLARDSNNQVRLVKGLPSGEIQLIAESLDDAFERINTAMNREKTLARNVSHELRTPLTVISTALGNDSRNIVSHDSINRARRACEEMELLTAACLDLSREAISTTDLDTVPIADTVKEIVKEYLYLLDGKETDLELVIKDNNISSPAPGSLARLVIGNVIRNAFIHCPKGSINITLTTARLAVTNSIGHDCHGAAETQTNKRGFGVGLSVLGQASERLDWSFEISYIKEKNLVAAAVIFANS